MTMKYILRDKQYIKWKGIFYHVVGYEHPAEYALAFPKYAPTNKITPWYDGTTYYERLIPHYGSEGIDESINKIKMIMKNLTKWDNIFGAEVPLIPLNQVNAIYKPEEALSNMRGKDALETLTLELVDELSSQSNVPKRFFGVTGSLLIGIHNEKISDIDLTIAGMDSIVKVKETLTALLSNNQKISAQPFSQYSISNLIQDAPYHGLHETNINELFNRIWYKGVYKSKYFSLSPIRTERETINTYGQYIYRSLGAVELKATIIKPINPFYLPLRYEISNILPRSLTINELVSYDGFYLDLLKPNDEIFVKGLLQEVVNTVDGTRTFRIAIGVREIKTLIKIKQK